MVEDRTTDPDAEAREEGWPQAGRSIRTQIQDVPGLPEGRLPEDHPSTVLKPISLIETGFIHGGRAFQQQSIWGAVSRIG